MVKRRMPKHIVLPNGMWRFVKSGSSHVSHKRRARKHYSSSPKTKRVIHVMARRKKSYSKSKSGMSIKNMAIGAAVTAFVEPYFDSYVVNAVRTYVPAVPAGAIKAIAGYYIMKKTKGVLKGVGSAMFVLGINDTVTSIGIGLPQTTNASGVIM